jgi:hypothetical protein
VNLLEIVRDALRGQDKAWNPDEDETVRFLRQQKSLANEEVRRLRHYERDYFPLADYVRRETWEREEQ